MGWRALPSIEDVPEPVDLAILGVGNGSLEKILRSAGASPVRARR